MATVHSLEDLSFLAGSLREGQLVAFPTETVYGLGASALSEKAVRSIFEAKKRPLTDPIIVHVAHPEEAFKYATIDSTQQEIVNRLAALFWPGPLTVVLPGQWDILPKVLGGGSDFVGIRVPSHPVAQQLLKQARVPIAAPSANLFGHVSPTTAQHVLDDFRANPAIKILDGGGCTFGVESTVIKLQKGKILVLREGAVSCSMLEEGTRMQVVRASSVKSGQQSMESPGQMLRHYSPNLPCYICSNPSPDLPLIPLQKSAVLSFSHGFDIKEMAFAYYQVGQHFFRDDKEQPLRGWMRELYGCLRLAEKQTVDQVLVLWDGPQKGVIWDKIFRAAEGKRARV